MAAVVMIGGDRDGLHAPAAARGLRLVPANDPDAAGCRLALRLPGRRHGHDWSGGMVLHVVRGGEAAVVRALDAGVDDAIEEGASDAMIAARLAALARRTVDPMPLRVGELVIDRVSRRVRREGRDLALLPREYALLLALAARPGTIVSRTALYVSVFNLRFDPGTNVLAVHMSRPRAKLDRDFAFPMLRTEKGMGYRLVAADEAGG